MTRDEYEARRRALEAQLQADISLIHAAHEVRVRSLDSLWQAEDGNAPAAIVRETVPAAPAPARKTMRPRGAVLDDLQRALPQLPEVFDSRDVARVLGYTPARSTLFRALLLLKEEGAIAVDLSSPGGTSNTYRKLAANG
jgi:hypothetical protein